MRKLALLSVALLPLLGGCISSTCDYPTATLRWTLQDTGGVRWACDGVNGAGVSFVDIYIGNAPAIRRPCTDYGAVIDTSAFAPGTYPTTVEGVDPDGVTILDRAQFNLSVSECGNTDYYPVLGETLLNVDYHFGVPGTASDVCHGGYMWYALFDEVAGGYISVVDQNSAPGWKNYYGCYSTASGRPLQFSVPFGTYTLDWIQEVVNPTTTPNPVQQACVQPSIEARVAGVINYPVTLAAYAGVCP